MDKPISRDTSERVRITVDMDAIDARGLALFCARAVPIMYAVGNDPPAMNALELVRRALVEAGVTP